MICFINLWQLGALEPEKLIRQWAGFELAVFNSVSQ